MLFFLLTCTYLCKTNYFYVARAICLAFAQQISIRRPFQSPLIRQFDKEVRLFIAQISLRILSSCGQYELSLCNRDNAKTTRATM